MTQPHRTFAGKSGRLHSINMKYVKKPGEGVTKEEMPFYHHKYSNYDDRKRLEFDPVLPTRKKHKIPRKRASKVYYELHKEAVEKNVSERPNVLQTDFRVGDAIEVEMVGQGGVNSTQKLEKARGVVIGRVNKGLGASVLIRDVLFGTPVERRIPLHSPLLRSLKVLEKNFIYKGRRKVKRAKLYFLRDRPIKGMFKKLHIHVSGFFYLYFGIFVVGIVRLTFFFNFL